MSAMPLNAASGVRLDRLPAVPTLEFVAFAFPPDGAFRAAWPVEPGAVSLGPDDRPTLLHFAPARWLLPDPGGQLMALVAAAVDAGAGTVVDVSGKWQAMQLTGSGAARVLASAVDVRAVLAGRGCAALTLFDCPLVLAGAAGGFALWVRASYADDFAAAVERHRPSG